MRFAPGMLAACLRIACVVGLGNIAASQGPTQTTEVPLPLFDAHLHYNWEPTPYLQPDAVLALFKRNGVTGILATSRPNTGTHALVDGKPAGLWVVPFIRPYRIRADIGSWMSDPSILDLVQEEYQRGYYQGIGEFHLSGRAAAADGVKKTVDFAVEKGLYLHCHCDAEALEILFRHNPAARIIWAHTGFSLDTADVARLLATHPALWGELSYRSGITDSAGSLTAPWRQLFERHPNRFLIGSDTWVNERWASYDAIIAGYRQWLTQLPPAIARQIAHGTATRLFAPR